MTALRAAVLVLLVAAGCSTPGDTTPDTSVPPPSDAGTDAATPDTGPGDAGTPDAAVPDAGVDAGPPRACEDAPPMALGACADLTSGGECVGVDGEVAIFDPMGEGDPLRMVIGPQGAPMFIMSLRVTGVDPGDASRPLSTDNPRVEIVVTDEAGTEISHYRGLHALEPDPDVTGWLVKAGLFVVIDERPALLVDHMLTATAVLRDRFGFERCGVLVFRAIM